MKSLLLFLCFSMISVASYAGSKAVNSEDNRAGIVAMEESTMTMSKAERRAAKKSEKQALKAEKRQVRAEKRMAWANRVLERKMAKNGLGGISDPIDRWLWYAIFAAAGAIIFAFIWTPISVILWIATIVFIVLWLIKKFG